MKKIVPHWGLEARDSGPNYDKNKKNKPLSADANKNVLTVKRDQNIIRSVNPRNPVLVSFFSLLEKH